MAFETIDGITQEPLVNFVGKDGFYWWVGEVEDNEDPMALGRVKCRVLGYYTNVRGGTTGDLPTKHLPWATVLQHTSQPGNDKQGESSGQLQPGAIVMGFFMDGDSAQMPIVIGVLRTIKSDKTKKKKVFAFTGKEMEPGLAPNVAALNPMFPNSSQATEEKEGYSKDKNTSVNIPGEKVDGTREEPGSKQNPNNLETSGSGIGSGAPKVTDKPRPAANGVGGPWKTLEYQLQYLMEDLGDTASTLVKAEDGDFLDVMTGKLVTAKKLTTKLQNFLGAVFAQVISAMRQALANLAESLKLATILGSKTGAPMVIFGIIQSAVKVILSALCGLDSNLTSFIADPMGMITSALNGMLEGLIDRAQFVMDSVQKTIDSIVCNVQSMIDSIAGVVSKVTSIVDGIGKAKELIEAWKKGSGIFADGFDLIKNGKASITGIIKLILGFIASDCGRKADGGEDTVGWYPLLGVTHCTPEELKAIEEVRGKGRGTCGGDSDTGGLFDSIFKEADPYLTVATTFLDGAYDLHIGNPGKRATESKKASGSKHLSICMNNHEAAYKKAAEAIRQAEEKSGVKMTKEEKQVIYDQAIKVSNKTNPPNKGDRGCLVADHLTWVGNRTQDIDGDDCLDVAGDQVHNIHGDYHLDVTGNCHITVGGGFFFNAQGAPKSVDKNGNKGSDKIQKHTIEFGSDVDILSAGAKIGIQGSELDLASLSTKVSGSIMEVSSTQQSYAGGEILISGDNSIDMFTTSLYQVINFPQTGPAALAGIRTICAGSIETVMKPGGSAADAIPRWIVANPAGPISMTSGATGYNNNVIGGAYNVNAAGVVSINAGGVASLIAGGAMNLTAGAALNAKAATIFLN